MQYWIRALDMSRVIEELSQEVTWTRTIWPNYNKANKCSTSTQKVGRDNVWKDNWWKCFIFKVFWQWIVLLTLDKAPNLLSHGGWGQNGQGNNEG